MYKGLPQRGGAWLARGPRISLARYGAGLEVSAAGTVNENVAPSPSWLSTQIRPSWEAGS